MVCRLWLVMRYTWTSSHYVFTCLEALQVLYYGLCLANQRYQQVCKAVDTIESYILFNGMWGNSGMMMFIQDLDWTVNTCMRAWANRNFRVWLMGHVSLAILQTVLNVHPPFRAGMMREIAELQILMLFTPRSAKHAAWPRRMLFATMR